MEPCRYCGNEAEWYLSSPSYGAGSPAQYAHSCSKAGMRITQMDGPSYKDLRISELEEQNRKLVESLSKLSARDG